MSAFGDEGVLKTDYDAVEHVTFRDTDIILRAEHELLASRLALKREDQKAKANEIPED